MKDTDYKPTIFIASSGKSKIIAEAVKSNFDQEADVYVWTENIFRVNEGTLETLMNRASYYDFFIAIFSADDKATIQNKKVDVTRDNVIFEFGLFLGRIGLDRTFFVLEEGVELFSDWKGITTTQFTRSENLASSLGASCISIKEKMQVAEKLFNYAILPSTSLAIGYYHNFLKPVLEALQNQKSIEIILEYDKVGNVIRKMDYELKKPYPTIEIRVPRKLSTLQREIVNNTTANFQQIILKAIARPFPFYVKGRLDEQSKISLFDIPTTLYASFLTIKEFFKPAFLATDNNEQKIIDKEIRNFRKTLSKLIPDGIERKFYKFTVY
jgi:hypothetical protein